MVSEEKSKVTRAVKVTAFIALAKAKAVAGSSWCGCGSYCLDDNDSNAPRSQRGKF